MASLPKKGAARASLEPDLDVEAPGVEEAVAAVAEPAAEMQETIRATLEKSVVESRAVFAKAKASADEAATAFEQSLAAAKDGVIAINAKTLEAFRTNTEANLDFVKACFAVKSLSDLVALQTDFARKRVDTATAQIKDLGALMQKAMVETIEPVKGRVAKSFKFAV
jgi:phasin